MRRFHFKPEVHIEGSMIWLPLKFDCLSQKEEKNNVKRNELAIKGKEIFLVEATFQEGTTFLQPDPCMGQPLGSHRDRVLLIPV